MQIMSGISMSLRLVRDDKGPPLVSVIMDTV